MKVYLLQKTLCKAAVEASQNCRKKKIMNGTARKESDVKNCMNGKRC